MDTNETSKETGDKPAVTETSFDSEPNFAPPPPDMSELKPIEEPPEPPKEKTEEKSLHEDVLTTHRSRSAPSVFTIIIILIALAAAAGLAYLGYQVVKGGGISFLSSKDASPASEEETITQVEYSIDEGSIYKKSKNNEKVLIVNKEDYPESGLIGFARVTASPNSNQICFESYSPATSPKLYLADAEGVTVTEVGLNLSNCTWHPSGEYILFEDTAVQGQSANIYLYHIESQEIANLTENLSESNSTIIYNIASLSSDGTTLECRANLYDTFTSETTESPCSVDLPIGLIN